MSTDDLDCHPLIRAFFADEMRKSLPETWRLAHRRLYEHYKVAEELPAAISQIAAIIFGCRTRLPGWPLRRSAFQDVYWHSYPAGPRFREFATASTLGSTSKHLAHFFSCTVGLRPVRELLPVTRARIITQAGFDHYATAEAGAGRCRVAEEALRAYEGQDWQ